MDQLELNSHTTVRLRNKKFVCSHKYQEKKVVQIAEDQRLQSRGEVRGLVNVVSASNLTKSQQTVIQNSFSNEDSPAGEDTGEKTATPMSMQTAADPTLTQTAGQFYVMMTPSDALHSASQLTLAPRTHMYTVGEHNAQEHEGFNWKMDSLHTSGDERRRAQHNEVERRRRDKINNWIVALSKIIPDCSIDGTKTGASKGGILSKACDYIGELKQHNQRLQESLRGVERVQMDNELLRQQLEELKSKNGLLRAQLEHHGRDTIADDRTAVGRMTVSETGSSSALMSDTVRLATDEVKGQEVSISTNTRSP